MTVVKARDASDEPVTESVRERAIVEGRKRHSAGLHAASVQYLPALQSVVIGFADRSAVALPVENYPELAELSRAELDRLVIGFGGNVLCLDERDLHVSIAGLVSASQPLMEMVATVFAARNGGRSSPAKAQAARKNGRKGGRPRKLATAG
jgi:hypothetical protein